MSEINYLVDALCSSLADLINQRDGDNDAVISILRIQHYLMTRISTIMSEDSRYKTVVISAIRCVAFLERDMNNFEQLEVRPNVNQIIFRNQRCVKWISVLHSIDYAAIRERNGWIRLELSEFLYHPIRVERWIEEGNELESYIQ